MTLEHQDFVKSAFFFTDYPVVDEDVQNFLDEFSKRDDLEYEPAGLDIYEDQGAVDTSTRNTLRYHVGVHKDKDDDHTKFDNIMFQIVSQSLARYTEMFPFFNYNVDTGYEILKYEEGGEYVFHVDASENFPRVLTFLYFLNDDYEGGELQMWEDGTPRKMTRGGVCIFPSSSYFMHRVLPVIRGERRSVVSWLGLVRRDDEL